MAFLEWLKQLLSKRTSVSRNVSSLEGTDASLTTEMIDVSGGPLKPGQRRRAIRDRRFLPKPRPSGIFRRKKYLQRDEADRLFSDTLRTKDRNIRDLLTDDEQLVRYGLPLWRSEEDVARALEISVSQLRHYSIHRNRDTCSHYVTFAVPKRSGGQRLIHAPKRKLKALQRRLAVELVDKLPVSRFAHGFVRGRSVATNAAPHVHKKIVIKLDLQDCFPSIHFGRVRSLFIALGYAYPVATCLAVLMTEAPRQRVEAEGKLHFVPVGPRVCVQGAPTSPGLCNAILMRLDHRLAGLAKKYGFAYTRYADDLTLSGDEPGHAKWMIPLVTRICREEGFRIHRQKTRLQRAGGRQQVTGVTVNEQAGLSRCERRRLRAAIHQLDKTDRSRLRQLTGKLAYLSMLNPQQAVPLRQALKKAVQQS